MTFSLSLSPYTLLSPGTVRERCRTGRHLPRPVAPRAKSDGVIVIVLAVWADGNPVPTDGGDGSRSAGEEDVHVLEWPILGLRVEDVDDGDAGQVDGHKEEVDAGPDGVDPDGPDLGDHDRADGPRRGREVEPAGADGGGEDLRYVSFSFLNFFL